jgi:hypothetical protein
MRLCQNFSPFCPLRPELHVLDDGEQAREPSVSWNVRTWPKRDTLNAGTPDSDVPSKIQVPASGLSNR